MTTSYKIQLDWVSVHDSKLRHTEEYKGKQMSDVLERIENLTDCILELKGTVTNFRVERKTNV